MSDDLRDAIADCIPERVLRIHSGEIIERVLALPEIVDMLALRRLCGDLTVEQVARALGYGRMLISTVFTDDNLTDDEKAISQWREPT